MSYRLINSNELAIKFPEVNDMPCIYADIPNGLNGEFYDLSVYPKIEQIRAEIEELDTYYDNDYFSGNRDPMFKCNDVLEIIDKYKYR